MSKKNLSDAIIKLPKYPHAITLDSNPILWSEKDVFWYLKRTDNCSHLATKCRDEVTRPYY